MEPAQIISVILLFVAWFSYAFVLRQVSKGSLNDRLAFVRTRWMANSVGRAKNPFDAMLLGNIVNSMSFFGSATMLVLAALFAFFSNSRQIYDIAQSLPFASALDYDAFFAQMAIVNVALGVSFLAFTYALRQVTYVIALVGAFPSDRDSPEVDAMIKNAATVLTEALKTFNFGIRGYYYFVAALVGLVSPYLSIAITILVTALLIYRQLSSRTAVAIGSFVAAAESYDEGQKRKIKGPG